MSGGYFDYSQYKIEEIAEEIERVILENDDRFGSDVIEKFKEAKLCLQKAFIMAHRIDWLLSGDDGEETFMKRLENDLKEITE